MAQSFQVSLPAQAQGFDPAAEQEEIARRRRMADMLRQQSAQPEGQMVSGRFVAPSITQRLAGLFNAYSAGQVERRAGDQARQLGRSVREQEDQGNARIVAAATGPGQSLVQTAGPDVPDFMRPSTQPTAPDPATRRNNMISAMMSHPNPAVRAQALSLATQPAQQVEFKVAERFNERTGQPEKVFYNPQNPQQVIPFGGTRATPLEFVNEGGQIVPRNRYTAEPVGSAIPRTMTPGERQSAANAPFVAGPDGQAMPNQPVQQFQKKKAAAGATRVSVPVSVNTERQFLGQVADAVGKDVADASNRARSAISTIGTLTQISDALDSGAVMAGPGTTARVFLGQVGQVLGVTGSESERLTNTRQVIQGLAKLELDSAQAMRGQGAITEAERGIIRRAALGQIDDMTVPEMRTLIGVIDRSARSAIRTHRANVDQLRQQPGAGPVIPFLDAIQEPAPRVPRAPGGSSAPPSGIEALLNKYAPQPQR